MKSLTQHIKDNKSSLILLNEKLFLSEKLIIKSNPNFTLYNEQDFIDNEKFIMLWFVHFDDNTHNYFIFSPIEARDAHIVPSKYTATNKTYVYLKIQPLDYSRIITDMNFHITSNNDAAYHHQSISDHMSYFYIIVNPLNHNVINLMNDVAANELSTYTISDIFNTLKITSDESKNIPDDIYDASYVYGSNSKNRDKAAINKLISIVKNEIIIK